MGGGTSHDEQAQAALRGYVRAQADALERASEAARRGDPEGVHDVRVAARRARSALAAHRRLLPHGRRDEARALERDLREHGAGLSARRDAQAARDLVAAWADALAWPADRTRRVLGALSERQAGTAGCRAPDPEALLAERTAAALAGRARATAAAAGGGRADLRRGVDRSWRRVSARWRVAAQLAGGDERDQALHEVRKAAKRLRYAAEVAAPVDPQVRAVADAARAVQRLLGDRQDAVVVARLLADPGEPEATEAALAHARRLAGTSVGRADAAVPAAVHDLRDAVRRWGPPG